MTTTRRFSPSDVQALSALKSLGVRAGATHRCTRVWVVVVEGRVFVRSWNDKPTGWYRALRTEPRGSITLGAKRDTREIAVHARHVRSARLRRAVSDAYAHKYDMAGARQWGVRVADPPRGGPDPRPLPAS